MRKALVSTCLFAAAMFCLSLPSAGQEIIHALTGTISGIDAADKTITVLQDNGDQGIFHALTDSKTRIAFNKKVEAQSTAAHQFDKQGAYAIIFYYGMNDNRTAVAVKGLGAGPFSAVSGTITKYDGHSRSVTVQDEKGAEQTFRIDPDTVAETGVGVVDGQKFDPHKGDRIRVVMSQVGGAATALFVRDI